MQKQTIHLASDILRSSLHFVCEDQLLDIHGTYGRSMYESARWQTFSEKRHFRSCESSFVRCEIRVLDIFYPTERTKSTSLLFARIFIRVQMNQISAYTRRLAVYRSAEAFSDGCHRVSSANIDRVSRSSPIALASIRLFCTEMKEADGNIVSTLLSDQDLFFPNHGLSNPTQWGEWSFGWSWSSFISLYTIRLLRGSSKPRKT